MVFLNKILQKCHNGRENIYMSKKKNELETSLTFSNFNEDDSGELIQLIAPDDEDALSGEPLPDKIPILPIRNTVLFPGVVIPITVGRQKSIKLIKELDKSNKIIGTVAQKDQSLEEPEKKDFFKIGTIAKVLKVL